MSSLSFQEKLKLQSNYGVVLCNSHTPDGDPFFHYVMAHQKNIEKLFKAQDSGQSIDFESYGEILLSGWGETPPPEYDLIISEYFQAA